MDSEVYLDSCVLNDMLSFGVEPCSELTVFIRKKNKTNRKQSNPGRLTLS